MKGMAGSQHFMRVVADRDIVRPGYLHAYLAGRFGVPLIVSGTYGSIIQHIEPAHIACLPVPRFGDPVEKMAHEKVVEAANLRGQYQDEIRVATRKMFESVGLKDITSGTWHTGNPDLGFVRKIGSPASLRALNFNPRFLHLCESIRSRSSRPLGSLCKPGTLHRGGRYKRIDADPEYSYQLIGQKEIFWLRPEGRWIAKRSVGDDVLVPPGTTLAAARGTFGESELYCRSELVWGRDAERAYSEDFLRVTPDERVVPPGCLFAFMRSETAFRMLRSISMGTKLQDHHPEFLRSLPVPYPEKRTREEIHELIVDAYEKRHRSVRLEDEAVALVERAIDRGV
jgi:type I restriction enzyme S subunit